ncbi:Histone-lysine N-methyltransferase MEDEA [Cardamine amara subsp. amara]|uniref:[histone H3]-lysine(27) N-trimethyltransferase n=1 Tax=Cardamine amara subsp. amara TaxID=228776 RepID=A0ABD0ZQ04_CARAN
MNQVKEQIEKERLEHINKTFELRCIPSVTAHVAHHQLLALTRSGGDDNNGRDKNLLLSRMQNPLRYFSGFLNDPNKKNHMLDDDDTLPTINLPFVEQLPRSMTYVFADRNQLMDEGDSVIGKRQSYYVDGDALEFSSEENEDEGDGEENKKEKDEEETKKEKDEEEIKKEKYEFSEDADRLIWEIGQKYDLDDLVVQSTLANFLELDYSYILTRYNELKLKNKDNAGEVKSIISTFQDGSDRLFCRRCLIFDCRTHEKSSQPEIQQRKKNSNSSENEDDIMQCIESCYLKVKSVTETDYMEDNDNSLPNKKQKNVVSEMTMWTPVEKDLYLQGVEIFGRNSCLISRNVLSGLKTCLEVYNYMREQGPCTMLLEEHDKTTEEADNKVKKKKKVYRKTSKFLYGSARHRKYARYPPALRKSSNGEDKLYNQYTPCTCTSTCGDQCICLTSGNCCEKYCGCPKECNNRFGGCNCAKGQCINRQCPCFAVNRECDPDLCRSCRPSFGDGSLGQDTSSEQRQCSNMKFLLSQHKKILLAKSKTHGWGAFTRDALEKNEFLGEYTGELVSEEEADERGKAYGKLGTSYLFTMNDQFDVDAVRKGNKFKFLNHSSKPNCYSKLMVVRGDHRIGIFAVRAIEKGEELFFNYCYGPGQAPWFN